LLNCDEILREGGHYDKRYLGEDVAAQNGEIVFVGGR